jgi:sugar/nucleoside kinase (ribokinase family)
LPAFPTEVVVDPTGAGDSFAGGLMGHLAASHPIGADTSGVGSLATLQRAMAYGTVVASFTIEQFSLERLTTLTEREVTERMVEFGKVVRVG